MAASSRKDFEIIADEDRIVNSDVNERIEVHYPQNTIPAEHDKHDADESDGLIQSSKVSPHVKQKAQRLFGVFSKNADYEKIPEPQTPVRNCCKIL